jgi:hypothetical protein
MQSRVFGKVNVLMISAIALVVIIAGVVFWAVQNEPEVEFADTSEPQQAETPIALTPLPETPDAVATEFKLLGELPPLNESDAAVESHLRLLGGMEPLEWIAGEQILRRIVVQIANITEGEFVYQQSPLVQPDALSVRKVDDNIFLLDPSSYQRYDPYVELLASIEPDLLVAFYRYYEPLLDQAYSELGNPIGAFRGQLVAAIEVMLTAPVIEGDIELVKPEANYQFRNPQLEALSPVQKQLIRMGPENTRRVQSVLRAFITRIR